MYYAVQDDECKLGRDMLMWQSQGLVSWTGTVNVPDLPSVAAAEEEHGVSCFGWRTGGE